MEIVLSKGGGTAIVVLLFAGVCYLLRYLYGPKGKLRDPRWDILNEQARLEERIGKFASELQDALPEIEISPFMRYTRPFFVEDTETDPPLRLKQEHTLRVLANARAIADKEPAFAEAHMRRALLLAALYHDVGRFEQFWKHRTFSDAASSCNHGALGARVLRKVGLLAGESRECRQIVLCAVAVHNRFRLPIAFSGTARTVAEGLRDADKIDILRVLRGNLEEGAVPNPVVVMFLKDEPGMYSPALLDALEQGRLASFLDMKYINDFRLLLCTWLHDFTFAASLAAVKKSGNIEAIITGLGGIPEIRDRVSLAVQQFFAAKNIAE